MQQAADLCKRHGGIMRIGKTIIIPAILALSAVGSIVAGSAATVATAQGSSVHVVAAASSAHPGVYFRG